MIAAKTQARQAAKDIATVANLYIQISDNDLDNGNTIMNFVAKIEEHLSDIKAYQVRRIQAETRVPHMNSAFGTPKLELPRKRKCPEPPAKKKISEMFPVKTDLPEEVEDSDENNCLLDETILDPEFQEKHHKRFMRNVRKYLNETQQEFDEVDECESTDDDEEDVKVIKK